MFSSFLSGGGGAENDEDPMDLRSNPLQGGGDDVTMPSQGPITRAMARRIEEDLALANKGRLHLLWRVKILG
ncbi:hypothetical protein VNO78_30394 [Psophocarpus tetragonolobus]|uniref:Uncharacterized protein n=1 Tax=Psophocarpus tetragonolobus TaxID=3891 RepID=A0AAN9RX91_PSOTE